MTVDGCKLDGWVDGWMMNGDRWVGEEQVSPTYTKSEGGKPRTFPRTKDHPSASPGCLCQRRCYMKEGGQSQESHTRKNHQGLTGSVSLHL